jgi:Putative adhesin
MGKRELLLIGSFVLVGVVVYYATAPAAAPGQQGFSFSKLIDHIRRDVRGNPASAEVKNVTTTTVGPEITEVRFESSTGTALTIVGEDRKDISSEMQVWSNGADEGEARRYAGETRLKVTEAGGTIFMVIEYPKPAEQRATLSVRLPKRLAVRVQPGRAKLDISDVASLELVEARGQVTVRRVTGRLAITHRGGPLTIESVATAKLNTRGSVVVLKGVAGDTTAQMQAGELRAAGLTGPVEIESSGTKIQFEDVASARKAVRFNVVGGSIALAGVRSDLRVDARDARVEVAVDKPAAIAIYTEGDEPLEVTPPPGGFAIDALAMNGQLTVPEGLLEVKTSENEQRASGAVAGGGPTITLRSSRGDIIVRSRKSET